MKKLSCLGLLLGLAACAPSPKEDGMKEAIEADSKLELTQEQMETGNFEVSPALEMEFSDEITCTGITEVAPEHQAEISPIYSAYVSETHLLSGQKVNSGDVLFYLESPLFIELQEQYLKSKAQYLWLKKEVKRLQALANSQAIAEKELLEKESAFQNAEAEWQALSKKLNLLNIEAEKVEASNLSSRVAALAPISGIISEVHLSKGKYLEAGSTALKIIDHHKLHLGLQIFEQDLAQVQVGQELNFRLQGASQWRKATIQLINPAVNSQQGTAYLHADINEKNLGNELHPGMFVEAQILSAKRKLLALPIDALVDEDGALFIYEAQQSDQGTVSFKKVPVELKVRNDDFFNAAEIKSGKTYLTKGAFRLSAG